MKTFPNGLTVPIAGCRTTMHLDPTFQRTDENKADSTQPAMTRYGASSTLPTDAFPTPAGAVLKIQSWFEQCWIVLQQQ